MNEPIIHILLIEDDDIDREVVHRHLGAGYKIFDAHSGTDGLKYMESNAPDCVLLDFRLPDMDGLEFLDKLEKLNNAAAVLMLTGQGGETTAIAALNRGAQDYLSKDSLTTQGLARAIHHARQRYEIYHENDKLVVQLGATLTELQSAKSLLEQKNRKLSEMFETAHQFVDNVSHEFRTPLTVIREFTSIMADGIAGPVTDDQREYLGIVNNRVDDLSIMVDDMLDISKLEAGVLGVSRKKTSLIEIMDRVRTTLERKALANQALLEINLGQDNQEVFCDPEKVGRVIINLAVNAFKFCGENGHVRLESRLNATLGEVEICIIDDGPGISPENLDAIFKRFQQVGDCDRSSTKGFGLGLNIAKELVKLNFGEIHVASTLGKGSTFSFTIPVAQPSVIMSRYLDNITATSSDNVLVGLLLVETTQLVDEFMANGIEDFLRSQSRGCDILLPVAQNKWVSVVTSNEHDLKLIPDRISNALCESNRNRPIDKLPELHFQLIGAWNVKRQRSELIKSFNSVFTSEEIAHA